MKKRTILQLLLIITLLTLTTTEAKTTLEKETIIKLVNEGGKPIIEQQTKETATIQTLKTTTKKERSIKELLEDQSITITGVNKHNKIFLDETVNITKANRAWNLKSNNYNLNGSNTSICIIDTGIDTNHPDLQNKIVAQKCFCIASEGANNSCCSDGTNENNYAEDNHGHGTHVAGIAAAYGNINGTAIGTNIVAVKTINSSGSGYDSDIQKAISWCANDTQRTTYNITTISMSLGGGQYTSETACNSVDYFNIQEAINDAVNKGINVVIATGNTNVVYTNNSAGIASPACLYNTTKVGATTKSSTIASYSLRHRNFKDIILAPGTNINSTWIGGGYTSDSGTSMATPAVAGIINIIKQYLTLSEQTKNATEINELLNNTGTTINDATTGNNYAEINAYQTLLELDQEAPNTTLTTPTDNTVTPQENITFTCNATDWQLTNITITLWNNTGIYYQNTTNTTGTNNNTNITITSIPTGTYTWNCESSDEKGNKAYATQNYTLTRGGIQNEQINPENNSYSNNSNQNFTCQSYTQEETELVNNTYTLWNSTGTIVNSSTTNITGTSNTTIQQYNITREGVYQWDCKTYNNESQKSTTTNRTITIDWTTPNITSISESVTTTTATITINTNEETNNNITGELTRNTTDYNTTSTYTITGLTSSTTYQYNITTCDKAQNCNTTEEQLTTTTATTNEISSGGSSSGGGGGGGTTETTTPTITNKKLQEGTTTILQEQNKKILELTNNNHSITLKKLRQENIELLIESTPQYINLSIKETKRINFTKDYYELRIELLHIGTNYANISIKEIKEPIPKSNIDKQVTIQKNETTKEQPKTITKEKNTIQTILVTTSILLLIILLWPKKKTKTLTKRKHNKKHETRKKTKNKTKR